MRQLTASQKIAQLENRIAQLEKQALLSDMKEKIVKKIEAFKSVKREVAPILKRAGSPEKLAKSYVKMSKTREYEQAMKELRGSGRPQPYQASRVLDRSEEKPRTRSRQPSCP